MPPERQVEFSPEAQLRIASHQPLHTAPDKSRWDYQTPSGRPYLWCPKSCNCWDEEYSEYSMFDGGLTCLNWCRISAIDAMEQSYSHWQSYSSLVQISVLQSKVQTCFSQTNHPKHCQSVLFRKFYALHRPVGDIPVLTLGTMGFICTDFRAKVPMSNENQQLLDAFSLRTWGKSSFRM